LICLLFSISSFFVITVQIVCLSLESNIKIKNKQKANNSKLHTSLFLHYMKLRGLSCCAVFHYNLQFSILLLVVLYCLFNSFFLWTFMSPPLHLTTCTVIVIVIVWRLRGILSELFYIGNMLPLQWTQLTKNSSYSPVGPWFFLCFLGCMIYLYVGV